MSFHLWFPAGFQQDKQNLMQMSSVRETMYIRDLGLKEARQVAVVSYACGCSVFLMSTVGSLASANVLSGKGNLKLSCLQINQEKLLICIFQVKLSDSEFKFLQTSWYGTTQTQRLDLNFWCPVDPQVVLIQLSIQGGVSTTNKSLEEEWKSYPWLVRFG